MSKFKKTIQSLGLIGMLALFSPSTNTQTYANDIPIPKKTTSFTCNNWKPYAIENSPSDLGIGIEILLEALKSQGYSDIKLKFRPWKRALDDVLHNKTEIIINIWKDTEREKLFLFSKPYAINKIVFIKRKGDPFEFNNLNDLENRTIGTMQGYSYFIDPYQRSQFKFDEIGSLSNNLKKLLRSRVDLVLDTEEVIRYTLNKNISNDNNKKITFLAKPLRTKPLYIACSKNNPNAKKLIIDFNKGLDTIINSGIYAQIFQKYNVKIPERIVKQNIYQQ